MSAGGVLFVLTTVSTEAEARAIAERLVNERLAACVNALPGVKSIYRWEGKVQEASEILLLVKTAKARLSAVKAAIKELHPYELPELVALEPADVDETFAQWIAESASPKASR
jgi:periplasmic divalent cation tolerance protein